MTRALRTGVVVWVSILAVGLLAGCAKEDTSVAAGSGVGGSDSEFVDRTGEASVTIQARDNVFQPKYVTVSRGTKVVFDNTGRNPHNAIPVVEGAFDEVTVDRLQPGDEATVTFPDAGSFPYYCSLHGTTTRGMVGEIRVVDD